MNGCLQLPSGRRGKPLHLVETHQPLLRRFGIGVLHEDGEQFQRIALRNRRAAARLIDGVQIDPGPAGVFSALHHVPGMGRSMHAGSNV